MVQEDIFNFKVNELGGTINSFRIKTETDYNTLISEVMEAKNRETKTSSDYRRIKRYDVLKVGDTYRLIVPMCKTDINIKYFVCNSKLYGIINSAHIQTGHGGIHKLEYNLKQKYANITRDVIKIFLENCEVCIKKKTLPKKGVVVKPMVFKEVNERGQVDLIDFQTCPSGENKFILNYQDHLSKFVSLRPLKTKTAVEVATHLVNIFCIFGAPSVLQSDNGREFVNSIIEKLKMMWPQLRIVHGKPRHSQSQGSVERANRDVQEMIVAWMENNKTNKWDEGLCFCQFQKNNSFHLGIKQSPFEVMFGRKPKLGLESGNLPVALSVSMEEELEQVISSMNVVKSGEKTLSEAILNENEVQVESAIVEDSSPDIEFIDLCPMPDLLEKIRKPRRS
ncbi:KRAB-A domain-containing protein 2-like [Diabrotica undecimpunctata]|uniref:KRAB-A domain-containing protein 2-like n=1 Tax=Diabrotica undecimpunctata TaxID=50387 RepID=UPI003B6330DA